MFGADGPWPGSAADAGPLRRPVGLPDPRAETAPVSGRCDPPERFAVASRRRGDAIVVSPSGELDLATHPALEDELIAAEQSDAPLIELDLRRLTFIDSAGMHLLERAVARSAADRPRLRIVPGPPAVQRVLALTGLDQTLPWERRSPARRAGDAAPAHTLH